MDVYLFAHRGSQRAQNGNTFFFLRATEFFIFHFAFISVVLLISVALLWAEKAAPKHIRENIDGH
jgi:hypothetical protein